jgi:hypothetical protein
MSKEPMFIHVFDCLTGIESQREMTPEEIAEHEARIADFSSLPTE